MKYDSLKQTSIYPLVVLRIAFGLMMAIGTIRFVSFGWIEDHYINPLFHFHYYGFSFIKPLGLWPMYGVHLLMFLAALGIMLGAFYRISSILFFLTFTYTELIDLTYYLNHYYFVSIAALLLVIVPAHRYFSVDTWRKPTLMRSTIPAWTIDIFKLQTAIVYTFAGIAKINHAWLMDALPLRIWLPAQDQLPVIGFIMKYEITAYVFSWAGMIYDCTIIYWLSNNKTRPFAYLSVLFFHIVTGMMFQIGVFPLVMICTTLIFFSDGFHAKLISIIRKIFSIKEKEGPEPASVVHSQNKVLRILLVCHFTFQLLFPFRYLLYPGNLFWTEQGYRFSWRVMLMEKAGTATFFVTDNRTGKEGTVVNSEFLNPHQEKQMAMQPDMILQYAHKLKAYYTAKGIDVGKIRTEAYVTLNAKPSKLLIDPQADLTAIKDGWHHKKWILPYE